ncbi:hypothetical protein JCM9279_004318 [Rhodotorula babjevae]
MSSLIPERPAVPDYPTASPYQKELDVARAYFHEQLQSSDIEWDSQTKSDVELGAKKDAEDPSAPNTVRGVTLVKGVSPETFLFGVITSDRMRRLWDARLDSSGIVASYSPDEFTFYSTTKGFSFVVSGRDIVGASRIFEVGDGYELVQTSVDDLVPAQKGKTRATLFLGGWKVEAVGSDTKVTYVVKVALNGSMPSAIVNKVATETPMCVGTARDTFHKHGFAPYIRRSSLSPKDLVVQNQRNADDVYRLTLSTRTVDAEVDVVFDREKLHKGGVSVSVEGEGVETSVNETEGVIKVRATQENKEVVVVVRAK